MTTSQNPDRPTDADQVHALQHDYVELLHALQTACEYGGGGMTGQPPTPADGPALAAWQVQKHLRVGINGAMLGHGSLSRLLFEKGILTELEYWTAMVADQRAAVATEEAALTKKFGAQIRLA